MVQIASLTQFGRIARQQLGTKGPVALVLAEDEAELDSTITHCFAIGFRAVVAFGAPDLRRSLAEEVAALDRFLWVDYDMQTPAAVSHVVNEAIAVFRGAWLHYCFNAEYLYFPFTETRTIGEMLAFNTEERRDSVLTYVIDLYSTDLGKFSNAVSRESAHFDRAGYFALARHRDEQVQERQLDFFGGLRWRYEEFIPATRHRIDRVALFRATRGLQLLEGHVLNIAEYNTYACPWHNNLTAALCSFRTAKALMTNPDSKYEIAHFWWPNSVKFEWNSRQLLDLGFIEPGQWF